MVSSSHKCVNFVVKAIIHVVQYEQYILYSLGSTTHRMPPSKQENVPGRTNYHTTTTMMLICLLVVVEHYRGRYDSSVQYCTSRSHI